MFSSEPDKITPFTNGHALLIGTGTDSNGKIHRGFESTINDVDWLYQILTDASRCAYPKEQVTVLSGKNATQEAILQAIESLLRCTGPDSTVIFLFSGHGHRAPVASGQTETHIIPFIPEGQDLYSCNISGTELYSRLKQLNTRKCVILLNCCFASGVVSSLFQGDGERALGSGNVPLNEDQINELSNGKGFAVLSSSRRNEISRTGYRGGRSGSSVFKHYSAFVAGICEGLSGAGQAEPKGYVTISDLAMYCHTYVRRKTRGRQNTYFNFAQLDNFNVSYYNHSLRNRISLGDEEEFTILEDEKFTSPTVAKIVNYRGDINANHGATVIIGIIEGSGGVINFR